MSSTAPKTRKQREAFGRLRKLPSGRFQAAYSGPDTVVHKAPGTFETLLDARSWLVDERRRIDAGGWVAPGRRNPTPVGLTVALYARTWLAERELKPRTRDLYRRLLDQKILSTFGDRLLTEITPADVRAWHATLDLDKPTRRAHAYSLLRTIFSTAVSEDLVTANPCRIRAAGSARRQHQIRPASLPEIEAIALGQPERYRALVLLAAWCALRFGELTELRRGDLDLERGVIRVRRAVTVVNGQTIIGAPKSEAGVRDVAIPPHLLPMVSKHIQKYAAAGKSGLIFPAAITGKHLGHGTYFKTWDKARSAAQRPDLRFHDLRHTGAVLAAQTGATLAELMSRLGHSTAGAAMRYQHAAADRDAEIARLLSQMVGTK